MNEGKNRLQDKTIIFLGSSVTYGSSAGGVSFVEMIAESTGCIAVKEAVSGTTLVDNGADSYIARMKELAVEKADGFVCQLSTNDASRGLPLGEVSKSTDMATFDTSTVAGAMEYIIAYARKHWQCPIAFYTNAKYDDDAYEAMIKLLYKLQEKWQIYIIDLWNDEEFNHISEEQYKEYMADRIHPTEKGYRQWWMPVIQTAMTRMFEQD